jgi:hypothetical protein
MPHYTTIPGATPAEYVIPNRNFISSYFGSITAPVVESRNGLISFETKEVLKQIRKRNKDVANFLKKGITKKLISFKAEHCISVQSSA